MNFQEINTPNFNDVSKKVPVADTLTIQESLKILEQKSMPTFESEKILKAFSLWEHRFKRPFQLKGVERLYFQVATQLLQSKDAVVIKDCEKWLNPEEVRYQLGRLSEIAAQFGRHVVRGL
jgi:hypothetical protein